MIKRAAGVTAMVLATACSAHSQAALPPVQANRVVGARLSPDGSSVIYALQPADAGSERRVLRIAYAGGAARAATTAEASAFAGATSGVKPIAAPSIPEAKILYVDAVGAGQQSLTLSNGRETWIDLMTVATGDRVTVMPPGIATILAAPSWSADGTRFVVVGENSEHGPEVFAGGLPIVVSGRPDFLGAPPPAIRRLTFSNQ